MRIRFEPMSATTAAAFRAATPDAYGNIPERHVSDGSGIPCRRCLGMVPKGKPYLLVAWRPFATSHAYAETGPVFLCAEPCEPQEPVHELPAFLDAAAYILRGYSKDERIVSGTGGVVDRAGIAARAHGLLARQDVAAVHIRSASNNCYHCRIVSDAAE